MKTYRRKCRYCGRMFETTIEDECACSPVCRTRLVTMRMSEAKDSVREGELELAEKGKFPSFDLAKNPLARVEWVFSLPERYRAVLSPLLTEREAEEMLRMEKRRMMEDRKEAGYFVKGSKKDEAEGDAEEFVDEKDLRRNTEGTDDGFDD